MTDPFSPAVLRQIVTACEAVAPVPHGCLCVRCDAVVDPLTGYAALAVAYLETLEEMARLDLRCRLAERQVERNALCPDHRDKGSGKCIVCQAEERTTAALRRRVGEQP